MSISFVYDPYYRLDIGNHVFQIAKYFKVIDRLLINGHIESDQIVQPIAISEGDILLTHKAEYWDDLKKCQSTYRTERSEIPLNAAIIQFFILQCGGTLVASRNALRKGISVHIGGGFHHSYPDHAEGFCYLNDIAIAVNILLKDNEIKKCMVIDLDVHQGNGVSYIFKDNSSVFTLSVHQNDLYPVKEQSTLDIGLEAGCSDHEYLSVLENQVKPAITNFKPDLIFYIAGADPYDKDQLGGLSLSIKGLKERDEYIYRYCGMLKIPIVTVLGGGYALDPEDTVSIHFNTCCCAIAAEKYY